MTDSVISKKKFEVPECWSNDMRMSALFAPFRSKFVNPTDWNSKMKFWTDLIESWCKHNKCPIVEISNLKNSFSRKGLVPACLDEVLQHLIRTGVLVNKDNFMIAGENWKSWAIKVLVTNPLEWTFNTVKSTIVKGNGKKEIYYVHLPVVKYLSEELLRIVCDSCQEKMVSFEQLIKLGYENPENLSVVLHWMQKQGLVAVSHDCDLELVKLSKNALKPVKITDVDLGIYNLERQQKCLEDNIAKLEAERDFALEETKKYLNAKSKNMAKMSLRRKKEIDKAIEKRAVALENIQAILHKIEQGKLDGEVIECYQKGIATLKQIFKESGLNVETVTGTMNELEEVLNSGNETEEALARPLEQSLEENLEDELSKLLLEDAPDVPPFEFPANLTGEKEKKKEPEEVTTKLQALCV